MLCSLHADDAGFESRHMLLLLSLLLLMLFLFCSGVSLLVPSMKYQFLWVIINVRFPPFTMMASELSKRTWINEYGLIFTVLQCILMHVLKIVKFLMKHANYYHACSVCEVWLKRVLNHSSTFQCVPASLSLVTTLDRHVTCAVRWVCMTTGSPSKVKYQLLPSLASSVLYQLLLSN